LGIGCAFASSRVDQGISAGSPWPLWENQGIYHVRLYYPWRDKGRRLGSAFPGGGKTSRVVPLPPKGSTINASWWTMETGMCGFSNF